MISYKLQIRVFIKDVRTKVKSLKRKNILEFLITEELAETKYKMSIDNIVQMKC